MGDRLDTLCLMAFNLYLADREQVYAERVAQQRREASQIRRWAARHGLVENQTGNRPCFCFLSESFCIVVTIWICQTFALE